MATTNEYQTSDGYVNETTTADEYQLGEQYINETTDAAAGAVIGHGLTHSLRLNRLRIVAQ